MAKQIICGIEQNQSVSEDEDKVLIVTMAVASVIAGLFIWLSYDPPNQPLYFYIFYVVILSLFIGASAAFVVLAAYKILAWAYEARLFFKKRPVKSKL